jgi:hypothetical protein
MPAPKMSLSRLLQLDSAAVTVAAAAAMPFLLAFLLSGLCFGLAAAERACGPCGS